MGTPKISWWISTFKKLFKDVGSVGVFIAAVFSCYAAFQTLSQPSLTELDIRDTYEVTGIVEWRKVSSSSGKGGGGQLTFKLHTSDEIFSLPKYTLYPYVKVRSRITKGVEITLYAHNMVRDGPVWNPQERPQVMIIYIGGDEVFSADDYRLYSLEQDYFSRWAMLFAAVVFTMFFLVPVLPISRMKKTPKRKSKPKRKKRHRRR